MYQNRLKSVAYKVSVTSIGLPIIEILYFMVIQPGSNTRFIETSFFINEFMFYLFPQISFVIAVLSCGLLIYIGAQFSRDINQKFFLILSLMGAILSYMLIPKIIG